MPEAGLNCIVCLREETTTPRRPAALIRAGRLDKPPQDWCHNGGSQSVSAASNLQTNVLNSLSRRWWNKPTRNNNAGEGFYRTSPCFTRSPLISCSDSLPGFMSAGHGVAHPVRARRQSWGRELCREEREGSQRVSHMLHGEAPSPLCPKKLVLHPRGHRASFHSQRKVAWLGDTERVSRVWAHLADCQQTGRGGTERRQTGGGRAGEGWRCGKWSSFKDKMLLHVAS